jgi:hypothetical protein
VAGRKRPSNEESLAGQKRVCNQSAASTLEGHIEELADVRIDSNLPHFLVVKNNSAERFLAINDPLRGSELFGFSKTSAPFAKRTRRSCLKAELPPAGTFMGYIRKIPPGMHFVLFIILLLILRRILTKSVSSVLGETAAVPLSPEQCQLMDQALSSKERWVVCVSLRKELGHLARRGDEYYLQLQGHSKIVLDRARIYYWLH